MSLLFSPGKIGSLILPNRIIRSATAEKLADDTTGFPLPKLQDIWVELSRGGTGLIITGHMYVHTSGKCHPEMTGIHNDHVVPYLSKIVSSVHREGGKIAVQLNHGGMKCNKESVKDPIAPSSISDDKLNLFGREMSTGEIEMMINAFAQAARRAKDAGFDAVQVHAAHGYLVNQFNSPFSNHREDEWGGNTVRRTRFLREVIHAIREEVGPSFPVFIKFGVVDSVENGLTLAESSSIISMFSVMGLDAIEVSCGIGESSSKKGIKNESKEAYFRQFSRLAKSQSNLPVILVGGLRSKKIMENVLECRDADFVSLSRPLINNPYLPVQFQSNIIEKSGCISSNNCWPINDGEGIACKCPKN